MKEEEKRNSYTNHKERSCKLYGACGNGQRGLESHKITLYGLHCLNKWKKD